MGFDPVSGIGTGCWPGMRRLAEYLFDKFGGGNLGCYNPRSMAGGGPSLHAEGRAQDFAFNANDPDDRAAGDALFRWAVEHADEIGLQEMLWRGAIWFYPRRDSAGGWGDFDIPGVYGPVQQADHMSHVHLGVDKNAGMNWEPSWVSQDSPTPAKPLGGRMLPSLFVDANGAVWVYDPNTKSKTWVTGPPELSAIQTAWSVAAYNGKPAGDPAIYRNDTTDALLAGAVENRTPKDGGGTIDLSGFTISGTFDAKAKA